MSSFSVFEHAHKKAAHNGRSNREATAYALKKYFIHLCDSHHLNADEKTQECVVEEAVDEYLAALQADGTHGDAARHATKYIKKLLDKAAINNNGESRRGQTGTSTYSRGRTDTASHTRGQPLYDYEDMYESLPRTEPRRSHTGHSSHVNTGHSSHVNTGHSSYFHAGPTRSYTTHEFRPSAGPVPGRRSFSTHEFHPSGATSRCSTRQNDAYPPTGPSRAYTTHEFRPSTQACHGDRSFSTHEFRPSGRAWLGGDAPRRSTRPPTDEHSYFSPSNGPSGGYHYSSPSPSTDHGYFQSSYTQLSYSYSTAPPPRHTSSPPPRSYRHFEPSQHSERLPSPPSDGIKPPTCFYVVLGIPRTATADEIKKAYRKMSLRHHPDRATGADKEKATAKMAEINQAKDVLSDPVKRRWYDRTGCVP